MDIPVSIFIIPYRDRTQHIMEYTKNMRLHMKNPLYKFFFIHQNDSREFNRGAMKNIGFILIKSLYPTNYKDINIVFNDVDTFPKQEKEFNPITDLGTVKHLFGFENTLGGIVVIKGGDFEKIGGFSNNWTWGKEDIILYDRCIEHNLIINRDDFNKDINQLMHSTIRKISYKELFSKKKSKNDYTSIYNIYYTMVDKYIHIHGFEIENDLLDDIKLELIDLKTNGNNIKNKYVKPNVKEWKMFL